MSNKRKERRAERISQVIDKLRVGRKVRPDVIRKYGLERYVSKEEAPPTPAVVQEPAPAPAVVEEPAPEPVVETPKPAPKKAAAKRKPAAKKAAPKKSSTKKVAPKVEKSEE